MMLWKSGVNFRFPMPPNFKAGRTVICVLPTGISVIILSIVIIRA
jgi:hypothetical protein